MERKQAYEKKNVLVAGGAGFIGSHLCAELVKSARVICVDNFLTGSEENIHQLLQNPEFKFLRHDVTQPLDLEAFPELKPFRVAFQGVQEVYNLACPASPKDYSRLPVETLLANGFGTKNLLDLAAKYQGTFVHLSSSAVYGEPTTDQPIAETNWGLVDPIGPRSSYAEGKRFAESLVMHSAARFDLDVKILRVFNTYGPKMKLTDGRMIPDFIASAIQGNNLVIHGDQDSMSTFNFISDLIEAILKTTGSAVRGPINIGSPEPKRVAEVAELVIKLAGSSSKVVYQPPTPHMSKQLVPDISLAKEKLGWFPVVPLEDGLKRTIDFLKGSRVLRLEDLGVGS